MSYKLNNILLSDYGIIAGRASGSSIAVEGIFDLPKRIGETHKIWDNSEIEAYTDADDIRLEGRDITFHGIVLGGKSNVTTVLENLKSDIKAYTDLVTFSTPYGDFLVKVTGIETKQYRGGITVEIQMRQPVVDTSGGISFVQNEGAFDLIAGSNTHKYISVGKVYEGRKYSLKVTGILNSKEKEYYSLIQMTAASGESYVHTALSHFLKAGNPYKLRLKSECTSGGDIEYNIRIYNYSNATEYTRMIIPFSLTEQEIEFTCPYEGYQILIYNGSIGNTNLISTEFTDVYLEDETQYQVRLYNLENSINSNVYFNKNFDGIENTIEFASTGEYDVLVYAGIPALTQDNDASFSDVVLEEVFDIRYSAYSINKIPASAYGLFFSEVNGRGELQDIESENAIEYANEGYQVGSRGADEITMIGFVKDYTIAGFIDRVKTLYALFAGEGIRQIKVDDGQTYYAFSEEGFQIQNVIVNGGLVVGDIEIKLLHSPSLVTVNLHENLVSCWELDDMGTIVSDAHGSNSLTLGSGVDVDQAGILAGAFYFSDGSTDQLTLNNFYALDGTKSFTVSSWVKPANNERNYFFSVRAGIDLNPGFYMRTQYTTPNPAVSFSDGTNNLSVSSPDMITYDEWHHIVSVYNADTEELKLYVDGELKGTGTLDEGESTIGAIGSNLYIGNASGYSTHRYKGYMDQTFFSAKAWNEAEIAEVYNNGVGKIYSNW